MKRKALCAAVALLTGAALAAYFWPLSFTALLKEDEPLWIACNEYTITPQGEADIAMHSYTLEADTDEYAQITEILSRYRYRRAVRTFIGDNVLEGENPGYNLQLYMGENSVILGGTGEIDVNTRIYRMGIWGSGDAQRLMEEIMEVLLEAPGDER